MDELFRKLGVDVNVSFYLIFFSLIWVRVLAMATVLPFLFGKPVPRYVLVGATMALTFFVFPHIKPETPPPLTENLMLLVVLYMKEAFYGLAIGFMVGIMFYAFSSVGQMIDNQRGMSIARSILPQLGEQASVSGIFLFQLGIVLYLSIGGHIYFLDSFFQSFRELPVLEFPVTGPGMFPLADLFMQVTGQVIFIAMQMAMPVIIGILLADLILGIANRVAPQINVWMLGFTVKGYLGILMVFISITVICDQLEYYSLKSTGYVDQTIELLQGKVPQGAPELPAPEEGLPKPEEGVPKVKTINQ
ncbi:MAG: flagellar biosynthetic protein FliR [Pseudomonadota bacterium]